MRMRANVDTTIDAGREIERPHMVEEDEWADHTLLCERQYAAHFQTTAEAATPLFNDHFYHFLIVRHRRIEQLLLPQEGDTATAAMQPHDLDHPFEVVSSGPVTLPLGRHSHPGHHVHSSPDHALNSNFVGLERDGARRISHHRHVPAFPSSLDCWHSDAYFGPQSG